MTILNESQTGERQDIGKVDFGAIAARVGSGFGLDSNDTDLVNHPLHYKGKNLECIQVIEAFDLGFCLGNAVKYILRAGKKGDKNEDILKAIWYLNREIEDL